MTLDHPFEFVAANIFTAQPDPYLWLLEVLNPQGGPVFAVGGSLSTIRVTPNATPVTFDGKTYDPFPLQIGQLRRDDQGGSGPIDLTFSNTTKEVMQLVKANDFFRDHRIKMLLVHSAYLASPSSKVTIPGTVTDVNASWNAVTLIVSAYNDLGYDVPQRLLTRRCGLVYRGAECGFTLDVGPPLNDVLGSCPKTLFACTQRGVLELAAAITVNHPLNFGGKEGLPVGTGG